MPNMNHRKTDKGQRNMKICNISLTSIDKDKINLTDNKTNFPMNKLPKSKPIPEIYSKFPTNIDKSQLSEVPDDCKKDIRRNEKNGNPKLEKTCKSKICGSCKNNSTKIKYKSHKAQLHVSIKNKKPAVSCMHTDNKSEENIYDAIESDCSNSKTKFRNCTGCAEKEARRSDLLLHFLNQMRNIVLTKEMKFDSLKLISERLVQDRKNAELLMLMDLIIRFQVSKVKEIIFQDLLSKKIIPVNFTRVFLKQYEFLKSLSLAYSDILKDYESKFLTLHDLSFDLMNRAHFKIHLYDDCKEIQDLIDAGHFNIKEELIFDIKISDKEKERIRIIFSDMKSDFETTTKWKDVQKNTENVLKNSCEVGKSLLKYFHSYCTIIGNRKRNSKKNHFDICHSDAENYINSLKELATNNTGIQVNDVSIKPSHEPNDYHFETSIPSRYYCSQRSPVSSLGLKMNCKKIYKSLANIKPPSLSRSSSSTNSNGYNSCVSTSSFEDSSDEDDRDRESAKILYNLKHEGNACDSLSSNLHDNSVNEETKPPTPVSFNGDEDCESRFDDSLDENHKRFIFNDKEHSWSNGESNHEYIEKFNKLYEKYLAENEHLLLDNSLNSPTTHMSVPDCIKSLQSAESLHSLLNSIMDKCKKGLDIQDRRSCHSTTHFPESDSEHIYLSSTTCSKHSDNMCSNFTEDNFSLDSTLLGIKDDDFDMDFEELSRTLSPNSTIHENLKEFEKYLGRSTDNSANTEKSHPHLHELVKTCRIYCNKLYKRGSKDELKGIDSIDSLSDSCREMNTDTKQTTIVIERISDDESCGIPDDCTSTMNVDIDSNQENCSNNLISFKNNLSSSETGSSSSTGTENAGNSKVCNCCKCEMFGEQNLFGHSRNATNVVEKLRLKLQKRKQCQLKSQSKKSINNSLNKQFNKLQLEDVDTLVKFINGDDDVADTILPIVPDMSGPASKKSKSKINKLESSQLKCKLKSSVSIEDNKTVPIPNLKSSKKVPKTASSIVNGFTTSTIQCNKSTKGSGDLDSKMDVKPVKPVLKDKSTNKENNSSNTEKLPTEPFNDINIQHIDDDKDIYDPVVEDFKRFCDKVLVVPKRRKKLPIDPTLLISELEKCQQENKSSNLFK